MLRRLAAIVFAALLVALTSGCAATRMLDSEVTSFARWTPAPPAPGSSYRFERLPSQQQADAEQADIENQALAALAKVGLQHNPQAANFSVQVSASTQPMLRSRWDGGYAAYPSGGPSIFIGGGMGGASSVGFGFGFPFGADLEPSLYHREVGIVMRELRGNTVVYETRAVANSPWYDSAPVLAVMLDAALRDFPVPPAGPRRLKLEIPR